LHRNKGSDGKERNLANLEDIDSKRQGGPLRGEGSSPRKKKKKIGREVSKNGERRESNRFQLAGPEESQKKKREGS